MKAFSAVLFGVMAMACAGQPAGPPFTLTFGKAVWKVPTRYFTTSYGKPVDNVPADLLANKSNASDARDASVPGDSVATDPKDDSSADASQDMPTVNAPAGVIEGSFFASTLRKPVAHVSFLVSPLRKPVTYVMHSPLSGSYLAATLRKPVTHVLHNPLSGSYLPTAPRKPVTRVRNRPLSGSSLATAPRKPVAHVLHRPLSRLTLVAAFSKPVVSTGKPVQPISDSSPEDSSSSAIDDQPIDPVPHGSLDSPDFTGLDKNSTLLNSPLAINQHVSHVLLQSPLSGSSLATVLHKLINHVVHTPVSAPFLTASLGKVVDHVHHGPQS